MEEEFRAILLASTAVTGIVGTRINWGETPQGQPFPSIALTVASTNNDHTMSGPDKLFEGRVQCDIYADSYGAAKLLWRAVMAVMDGYRGGNFQGVFHATSRDGRETGTNEPDRPFRISADFMTHWSA